MSYLLVKSMQTTTKDLTERMRKLNMNNMMTTKWEKKTN